MRSDEAPTEIAARYEVIELLGEGGMGRVYKAKDLTLNRVVAIKVLLEHYASQNIQRFQREAKAMSSLKFPSLIDVYDFGITDDGRAYLVMEYVAGTLLSDILKKQKRLTVNQTVSTAIAVADGMRHAHNRGIVHRDLKPSNILILEENNFELLKIFDFGISKVMEQRGDLTQDGAMLGTPLYMSPEQAQGRPVDGRADQYALGCIIYACITGHPPFRGDTALDTIQMHRNEPPIPLSIAASECDVPPALDSIVSKLLSKEPSNRFASMEKVMEALAEATAEPTEYEAITKMRQRRKSRIILNSGVAVAAVAATALSLCGVVLSPAPPVKPATKPDDAFWVKGNSLSPAQTIGHRAKVEKANLNEESDGSYSNGTLEKRDYDSFGVAQILPNEAFRALPRENVRKLSFDMRTRFEPGAMAQIASFPNLEELWFSGAQFANELSSLSGMKKLRRLTLNCTTMSDSDFAQLHDLPSLEFLSIENAAVSDSCLKPLATNLPNLTELDLGFTMLIGTELGELKRLKRLKRLELNYLVDDFGDKALGNLRGFQQLEVLDISGNHSISEAALTKVIAENPKLNLIRITQARKIATKDVIDRVTARFKRANRAINLVVDDKKYETGLDRYKAKVKRVDFEMMNDLIKSGD